MSKLCIKCGESFDDAALYCRNDGTSLKTQDPLIGRVLDGKYKIECLIGKGGMGNVYKAKHLHIGFPIAVKILHSSLLKDPTAVERFRREARSARAVNHPNAIQVMDFGITQDNVLYIVMEFIDGVSLQKILDKETILNPQRVLQFMKQICAALEAAHLKDIVHRDLKPDNILIINAGTAGETVKVIDFSIAKIRQSLEDPILTRDNITVGTPQYLSPEQAQGLRDVDNRADIYSLGIILYQMLTGEVPFKGKNTAQTLLQHIQAKPKSPSLINPTITIELENVILKSLEKSSNKRQQSVSELLKELEYSIAMSLTPNLNKINTSLVNKGKEVVSLKEEDILTKLALPIVTAKKTPSGKTANAPLSTDKRGKDISPKSLENNEAFKKSLRLFDNNKSDILPTLQTKTEPKKSFLQWIFSWFTVLFSN
jgi:serine/threonine-protein kinase